MSFQVPDNSPVVLESSEDEEYDGPIKIARSMQDDESDSEDNVSSEGCAVDKGADEGADDVAEIKHPGTRRSTRQRRAPQRLVITSSDSSKYDYVELSPQYEDCLDSRMEDVDEEFVIPEDSDTEFDTEFDTECDEEDDLDNKCFSDNEMEEDEEFEYLNRTAIECSDTDEEMTFSDSPGISDVDDDEESDEEET